MKEPARLAGGFILIFLSPVLAEEAEPVIGPDYSDAPETKVRDGVLKGAIEEFTRHSKNAGHTDGKVLRQTLPTALEWLWQGYVAK